jgi:hypothetical protein
MKQNFWWKMWQRGKKVNSKQGEKTSKVSCLNQQNRILHKTRENLIKFIFLWIGYCWVHGSICTWIPSIWPLQAIIANINLHPSIFQRAVWNFDSCRHYAHEIELERSDDIHLWNGKLRELTVEKVALHSSFLAHSWKSFNWSFQRWVRKRRATKWALCSFIVCYEIYQKFSVVLTQRKTRKIGIAKLSGA